MNKTTTVVYIEGLHPRESHIFTDTMTEVVPQLGTQILIGSRKYSIDRVVYNPTRILYSENTIMRVEVYVSKS